jgi:hypothetical protein
MSEKDCTLFYLFFLKKVQSFLDTCIILVTYIVHVEVSGEVVLQLLTFVIRSSCIWCDIIHLQKFELYV